MSGAGAAPTEHIAHTESETYAHNVIIAAFKSRLASPAQTLSTHQSTLNRHIGDTQSAACETLKSNEIEPVLRSLYHYHLAIRNRAEAENGIMADTVIYKPITEATASSRVAKPIRSDIGGTGSDAAPLPSLAVSVAASIGGGAEQKTGEGEEQPTYCAATTYRHIFNSTAASAEDPLQHLIKENSYHYQAIAVTYIAAACLYVRATNNFFHNPEPSGDNKTLSELINSDLRNIVDKRSLHYFVNQLAEACNPVTGMREAIVPALCTLRDWVFCPYTETVATTYEKQGSAGILGATVSAPLPSTLHNSELFIQAFERVTGTSRTETLAKLKILTLCNDNRTVGVGAQLLDLAILRNARYETSALTSRGFTGIVIRTVKHFMVCAAVENKAQFDTLKALLGDNFAYVTLISGPMIPAITSGKEIKKLKVLEDLKKDASSAGNIIHAPVKAATEKQLPSFDPFWASPKIIAIMKDDHRPRKPEKTWTTPTLSCRLDKAVKAINLLDCPYVIGCMSTKDRTALLAILLHQQGAHEPHPGIASHYTIMAGTSYGTPGACGVKSAGMGETLAKLNGEVEILTGELAPLGGIVASPTHQPLVGVLWPGSPAVVSAAAAASPAGSTPQ